MDPVSKIWANRKMFTRPCLGVCEGACWNSGGAIENDALCGVFLGVFHWYQDSILKRS